MNFKPTRGFATGRSLISLATGLVLLVSGATAGAGELLADNESALAEVLQETLPVAAAQFARHDSDVVRVYHHFYYDAETAYYTVTEDLIWWVQRGEAENLTNYVRKFRSTQEIEEVKAYVIHGGEVTVAAALAAEMEPLDQSRIKLQKTSGDGGQTTLVVAFDTARPGDLIGISLRKKISHGLQWVDWSLAGDYPTARCELEIKNSWDLAFAVFGSRFQPGVMKQEVLAKDKTHILHLRLWADDIDPISHEPYAPSRAVQSPSFSLVWRAEQIEWSGKHIWYEYGDWNMIASQFALVERAYAKKKKKTAAMAETLVDGATGELAVNRIYTFVRDELQNVSSNFYEKENKKRTVDAILKARAGDGFEKNYVLLQMLLSLDLDAEVVWVHDPQEGGFFPKYPNVGQLDLPLVRVTVDGREIWLDANCPSCTVGNVQSGLEKARAISYNREADELDDKVWRAARIKAGNQHIIPISVYFNALKRVNWYELFQLETGNRSGPALLSEQVALLPDDAGGYTRRLHLTSAGLSRLYAVSDEGGALDLAKAWAASRFADASLDSTVSESADGAEKLDVVLDLGVDPVPAPMGDNWILPADLIYGEPAVAAWPDPRISPFHIDHDNETQWEFRLPLPTGWTNATVPGTVSLGVNCFRYSVNYAVENGALVVRRSLQERGGTVAAAAGVALIGRQFQAIRELELSPVVLIRKD